MESLEPLKPPSLLRLNWWQRKQDSVAPALLRYCSTRDGQFDVFSRNNIKNKTVVITTCACAGVLQRMGSRGHFTHIIVDEAAQALEPEALVPVALAGPATRVTLAGKPSVRKSRPPRHRHDVSVHQTHCFVCAQAIRTSSDRPFDRQTRSNAASARLYSSGCC